MSRAVLWAGGWAHPPEDSIAAVTARLELRGFDVAVVTDPGDAASSIDESCDLLVVSACWFAMTDERYTAEQRAEYAVGADAAREAALDGLRRAGCPLLALHTAVICFDGWSPWREWCGGTWNWETSWHPPPADLAVVGVVGSPIEVDTFSVTDEEYQGLDVDDVESVATSGGGHPLVWLHGTDHGRAAVNLLGHDARSLDHPDHQALADRLLDWLLAGGD